jgi:hypothetical protein
MFDRALLASRLVILVANLASVVLALGAINQAAPRLLVVSSQPERIEGQGGKGRAAGFGDRGLLTHPEFKERPRSRPGLPNRRHSLRGRGPLPLQDVRVPETRTHRLENPTRRQSTYIL